MVNVIYLILGIAVGLLISHEITIKNRKKRTEQRMKTLSNCSFEKENESLAVVREINKNLMLIQQRQQKQSM